MIFFIIYVKLFWGVYIEGMIRVVVLMVVVMIVRCWLC